MAHKIAAQEREAAEQHGGRDPRKTLDELAEIAPLLAGMLADHHDVGWKPPSLAISEMRAEIERMRVVVARLRQNGPTVPESETVSEAAA